MTLILWYNLEIRINVLLQLTNVGKDNKCISVHKICLKAQIKVGFK